MTSVLRRDVLRISGTEAPASGVLPILSGVDRPGFDASAVPYAEMARNLEYGRPRTLLPYTNQASYTRDRSMRELPTVVLENEVLTATFVPSLGGRLWSLVHRPTERELLHRNPILQPANLALRDAWFAGGVEWNLGATGHWPLTCSPLHAVRLQAPDGTPVLRMFEFERMRRVVLRIDAWLPSGSEVLFVHVALHNPAAEEVPVYWWSNIAVPQKSEVRVLTPAERAFHFDYTAELKLVPFPVYEGADRSYPTRFPAAADYFMDIPAGSRRWIAALDEDGSGLVQTSTELLAGRKLFQWGTSAGGRRWQEWLSGAGAEYLEIQAGLARTQLEHVPMPGGATWEWVEAYGLLRADAAAVRGTWDEARAAVGAALEGLVGVEEVEGALVTARRFGESVEVLGRGSGWGALEVEAGFLEASADLSFGSCDAEQQPWLDLLSTGTLPISDPPAAPITGQAWRALLEESASDWHAWYHLGLLRLADDDEEGAREAWKRSLAERPTAWTLRALAHLESNPAETLLAAHRLEPSLLELTIETLQALLAANRAADALDVVASLPPDQRAHGRVRLHTAQAALATGDLEQVRMLLEEGITVDNLREGEASLDILWLAAYPDRPVPPEYDFRMSGS